MNYLLLLFFLILNIPVPAVAQISVQVDKTSHSAIDTSHIPYAKLVRGEYKIGVVVLEGKQKSEYKVIEFSFRWKRKNFTYEFIVKHQGSFLYPQAMEYFYKAINGDVIIIESIIAQNRLGKKISLESISYLIKK